MLGRQAVPEQKGQNLEFLAVSPQSKYREISSINPASEVKHLSQKGARKEPIIHEPSYDSCTTAATSQMGQNRILNESSQNIHLSPNNASRGWKMENIINQVSDLISAHNGMISSGNAAPTGMDLTAAGLGKSNITNDQRACTANKLTGETSVGTMGSPTLNAKFKQNSTQGKPLQTHNHENQITMNTDQPKTKPTDPVIKRIVRSDGFYLEASIEGVEMVFTIDTGATKTVISERVYHSIPLSQRPVLRKTTGLTDATGQPLTQLGTATFKVNLAPDLQFESDIIVASIEDEGLLGHDLLTLGNAHLLYDEGALQFMGVHLPCMRVGTTTRVRKIHAADHFIIPGYCEKIIDVFVELFDRDDEKNTPILLEPSQQFQEKYGLLMASSLSDLNSKVTHKVRLLNPNKVDISINQDATLGTAENIHGIVTLTHDKALDQKSFCPPSKEQQIKLRRVANPVVPDHLKGLYESACTDRTDIEKDRIAQTLNDFQDTFSKNEFDLGLTNLTEHTIDVGQHPPIKQAPRRVPVAFASEEENIIKQLEDQGVIRKSTSPWASPICLVRKRSGKIRPCVDYRRLNEVTVKDAFPLPRINDCLDAIAGAKFLSTFDMTSGFHQIPIKESDIPKTAFCTKYGLYEYLTMPMGMTNSPACFQRLMEIALRGLQWHICLIYLDDVLVFGSNFEQHMQRVEQVLSRIKAAGLKLKPEKCQLLQTHVNFLGHTISAEGVLPNPDNLAKIKQWPVPTTPTHVRQILGLGSYYRRFVKGYSDLVRPLTLLTHKNAPFVWTQECQESFEALKEKLVSSEIMAYPQDIGLFILDTDASDTQVAGILSQIQGDRERVISYGSRSLNKAERNYCITDKELLAIRHFTEYYRQYLLGRKFLIRSDHNSLTYLFRLKEPKGRIARWIEILSAFDFSIEYRKGQKHGNVDSLSRCPDPWDCQCSEPDNLEPLKCGPCAKCSKRFREMQGSSQHPDTTEPNKAVAIPAESIRVVSTRSSPEGRRSDVTTGEVNKPSPVNHWLTEQDLDRVQKLQEKDSDLSLIISAMKVGKRPQHSDIVAQKPAVRYYWSIWKSLILQNGCLYRRFYRQDGTGSHLQFVVPKALRPEILQQMHNSVLSGHLGWKKTLEKLLQRFYWFNVRDDVHMWLLKCDTCAAIKSPHQNPKAPLGKMQVGAPLDRISTDFLGPLPLTPRNNRYILLATDHFTKWVEIMAVPDQTAKTCANKLLNEVIARYGCPLTILSDQGAAYESAIFHELCQLLEIRKTRTSPRNPRCNGQAERFNRSLLRMIKAYLQGEQENWDMNLGCLAAAYRATPCESTGLTPNLLMLGREVRLPAELMYGSQSNATSEIQSYGEYVEHLKTRIEHAHEVARKHLLTSATRQAEIYDAKLSFYQYQVGDLVWVALEGCRPGLSPKLQATYRGPCIIVYKYNDLNYRVQLSQFGLERVLHHNKLKPYEGENIPSWIQTVRSMIRSPVQERQIQ